jgi:hypothetical protein
MQLSGKEIIHNSYGKGIIKSVDDNIINIVFDSNKSEVRSFLYPAIFSCAKLIDQNEGNICMNIIKTQKQNKLNIYNEDEILPYDFKTKKFNLNIIEKYVYSEPIISDLKKYQYIMNTLYKTDVSSDTIFRKTFNGFYKIRSKPAHFYEVYYDFLQKHKKDKVPQFNEILRYLYEECGTLEASFTSKLLHTINPSLPIWDSVVLARLGLKGTDSSLPIDLRYIKSQSTYDSLIIWYKSMQDTEDGQKVIEIFDKTYHDNGITDIKKIDFIMWGIR